MKNLLKKYSSLSLLAVSLFSCEDVITVETPKNETKLVVEALLNDNPTLQTIKLTISQNYFDNTEPKAATGAICKIIDTNKNVFEFKQRTTGGKLTPYFDWVPTKTITKIGNVGIGFNLDIAFEGQTYVSTASILPVPRVDSIRYAYKENNTPGPNSPNAPEGEELAKKGYLPELVARDLKGLGNCYYIKGYSYSKTNKKWTIDNSQLAYDAAFQKGSQVDSTIFILPIRTALSGKLLQEGDSIRAEILSITEPHFYFIQAAKQEQVNGGLFATPPNQLPTNVFNKALGGKKAMGWFSISSRSTFQTVIDPKKAVKDINK